MTDGKRQFNRKAKHAVFVILVSLSAGSILAAILAGRLAWNYYLQRAELRLNPINTGQFLAENQQQSSAVGQRIVFFGDSRINRWAPRPGLPGVEMIWRGIDGETTAQMMYRFDSDVLGLAPTDVVIQAGINDLIAGVALHDDARAQSIVVRNLTTMVDAARSAGIRVHLMTIVRPARPPLWRLPVWSDAIYGLVKEVNSDLGKLASDSVGLLDADQLLAGSSGALPEMYSRDTLHFTSAAYTLLNTQLNSELRKALNAVQ